MKRYKYLAIVLLALAGSVFAWVGVAHAQSFKSGDHVTVAARDTVDSSMFSVGKNLDIAGTVNGDVWCASQNLTVSGTIHGDLICASQNAVITGTVDGSVRIAAQTMNFSGNVGRNVSYAGQTFTSEGKSKIAGDALIGSSDATLNGPVGRDISLGSQTGTINAVVGRNVRFAGQDLTFGADARVAGYVNYTSNNPLTKDNGAAISGTVTHYYPPARKGHTWSVGLSIGWIVYWFLALLLIALFLALLFPTVLQSASERALDRPWRILLIGLTGAFAIPAIIFVLSITIIGIPLALLVLLAWLLVVAMSGPIFGYYLGRLILRDSKRPVLIMLVGSTILIILYLIPLIGFIVGLAAYLMGMGMFLSEAMRRLPRPSYSLESGVKKK